MKRRLGYTMVAVGCGALAAMGCHPREGADRGAGLMPPEQAARPCGPAGLIDDMEDGNEQIIVQAGRSGYWYSFADEAGTKMEPNPNGGSFAMADGGVHGSSFAARGYGLTTASADDAYGGIGFSFTDPTAAYDASKYGGISFYAKAGSIAQTNHVRFMVPDVNTSEDGHICKECDNNCGVELELTHDWVQYVVPFSMMTQEPEWGKPLVKHITPSKIFEVQWQVAASGKKFDLWVDDVEFTGCATVEPAASAAPAEAEAPAAPPAPEAEPETSAAPAESAAPAMSAAPVGSAAPAASAAPATSAAPPAAAPVKRGGRHKGAP